MCSSDLRPLESTVVLASSCSARVLDSSVNYSGVAPGKPEAEEFGVYDPWCTGQSGAPYQGTLRFPFCFFILNPNLFFLLVCVEPLAL